jgi:hypothetical protein
LLKVHPTSFHAPVEELSKAARSSLEEAFLSNRDQRGLEHCSVVALS